MGIIFCQAKTYLNDGDVYVDKNNLNKKTTFISVPLGLGEFMARCLKLLTLGKVDLHRASPGVKIGTFLMRMQVKILIIIHCLFADGLKIEIEEYLKRFNKT